MMSTSCTTTCPTNVQVSILIHDVTFTENYTKVFHSRCCPENEDAEDEKTSNFENSMASSSESLSEDPADDLNEPEPTLPEDEWHDQESTCEESKDIDENDSISSLSAEEPTISPPISMRLQESLNTGSAGSVGHLEFSREAPQEPNGLINRRGVENRHSKQVESILNNAALMETYERSKLDAKVSFGEVEIRPYFMTVGDNPGCMSGAPVTLDWEFDQESVAKLHLDEYENSRGPKRNGRELFLNRSIREKILIENGHPRSEILQAARLANIDRHRRRQTVMNLKFSRVHEAMESAGRKLKRVVGKSGKAGDIDRAWYEAERQRYRRYSS